MSMLEWLVYFFQSPESIIQTGGWVMYSIFGIAFFLWLLIFERYWFLYREYPQQLIYVVSHWQAMTMSSQWRKQKVKQERISVLSVELQKHVQIIKTLIALCPLLGLLGTVLGMINLFDVLAHTGTGNARAMAEGVAQAIIPTMSGMVVALSGLYFSADIDKKTKAESFRLQEDFMEVAQ